MAETGERGEIAGINCNTAVTRKYTFARRLNCSKVATTQNYVKSMYMAERSEYYRMLFL